MRSDGATDGDHSEARKRIEQRRRGRKAAAAAESVSDDGPEFPFALDYLWGWFWEIFDGCVVNGLAPVSIGWRDLAAWSDLAGEALLPWESRLLVRLSSLRCTILAEVNDTSNKNRTD